MSIDSYMQEMRDIQRLISAAEDNVSELRQRRHDLTARYLKEHPLREEIIDELREAVREGRPFCCEQGLHWLADMGVDEIWAKQLNNWAYERLGGCTSGSVDPVWMRNLEEALQDPEKFVEKP